MGNRDARLIRIFIGEADTHEGKPLCQAIVELLQRFLDRLLFAGEDLFDVDLLSEHRAVADHAVGGAVVE